MTKSNSNNVNHPKHYNTGSIEVIDYIQDNCGDDEFSGFCKGNVLKYVSRASSKSNEIEDLKKARWYLDRLIAHKEVLNG